jgi:hypothetical protein
MLITTKQTFEHEREKIQKIFLQMKAEVDMKYIELL